MTVVPFEIVAVCGLKAEFWIVIVNTGDTLVWFALVVVTLGMGAVVITVVADVVTADVGAVATWVGVDGGPCGGAMHPAISNINKIAATRIRDHLPNKSVLIKIPHDVIIQ